MCENPQLFKRYIGPVLDDVLAGCKLARRK